MFTGFRGVGLKGRFYQQMAQPWGFFNGLAPPDFPQEHRSRCWAPLATRLKTGHRNAPDEFSRASLSRVLEGVFLRRVLIATLSAFVL
jgi:hypothetical protein